MSAPNSQIRILSLNCWGLKYVAKDREKRINAIANELGSSDYDIIGLQEIWIYADYELIRSSVASALPYSKYFYSGALGAGLAIFSKWPIDSASIHPYSLNGSPLDVAGGDWFVGKGAASVIISHPELEEIEVFNTHLYARGGESGTETHRAHRLVNAWEFAKLVRQSAALGRYVIALGDFNSIPSSLPMQLISSYASLVDSWEASNAAGSLNSSSTPSPLQAIRDFGITADSPLNTYSAGKTLDAQARRYQGKRLDYIFFREPVVLKNQSRFECRESTVVFRDKVPGSNHSFSDHFGLRAVLALRTESQSAQAEQSSGPRQAIPLALDARIIDSTLQTMIACYRASRSRSRLHLAIFLACIFILVPLVVGSAWLPKSWINPIFLLFTVFVSWLGTTMLYSGFIFGHWEANALTSVIEEMELLRAFQGRPGGVNVHQFTTEATEPPAETNFRS
ncbi:hypothetical protein SISSUDRAFT_979826 [Sistotremastrum suecicum HHB10207 ss-3]|uniref:Endonuclease/exonuclease/phosphatase domain-containing protein n=1 Tax=Sistotremastrum suecicum HHB10207 ss-3 TaxID=1314776 RepID=A0A166HDT2_9AGAM|nr:hypothetical protein SISSUDRAFT_979826 [Sistotremastrum suecicum HHB10207 ss-3]